MTNFFSLNTALTGIRAAQVGLETTSHNIANANTKGYTRQRLEQASRLPYQSPVGPVGTGVDVVSISRARNTFLDYRARTSIAQFRYSDAQASLLQRAEALLAEPEDGLTSELNDLWASFEDLALDPGDVAARRQVLAGLDGLAARGRNIGTAMDVLHSDTMTRLNVDLDEVNQALARLDVINRALPAETGRGTPNDLLNERDLLLDKLAGLANVSIAIAPDQSVTVGLASPDAPGGAVTLVAPGATPVLLSAAADGTVSTQGAPSYEVRAGGEVGGLQRFVRTDLPQLRADLTSFVNTLVTELNAQHTAGVRPDGGAGGPLLSFDPAVGLTSLTVAIAGEGDLATAGGPGDGTPPAPHDARNALLLAGLRSRPVTNGGATATLDEHLRGRIVGLARDVANATRAADSSESQMHSAEIARQSAHGVSIDEEMVGLVAYQRALEASSRVMTALDEVLDVLINRTGQVGR